ncbi:MAG: cytochrome d ubiquinol oxidase subunit II [Acetobacteraceae bacterium]
MNAALDALGDPSPLALFWAGVIAVAILVYVILDGFDLGVGILYGAQRDATLRNEMMASISPFWDGNETWLVIVGASLFAAFPVVYAVFLPAFYLPVLLLLFGLIFRGVAFEFRGRGGPAWLWDGGFWIGSTVVAFVQGAAIGAMIHGLPVKNNQYAGGALEWLRPLPVICGLGLVAGYALLGAGWLILKSESRLRDWAYRTVPLLIVFVLPLLALAAAGALLELSLAQTPIGRRPWAILFPLGCLAAIIGVFYGTAARRDAWPFVCTVLFFLCAFATLAAMFWPYMIPYSITVGSAAAPEESLSFLFWGAGIVALPVVAIYTGVIYWVFRGKHSAGY